MSWGKDGRVACEFAKWRRKRAPAGAGRACGGVVGCGLPQGLRRWARVASSMMKRTDASCGMRPGRLRPGRCQGGEPLRPPRASAIEPADVAEDRLVSVIVPCHNGARFLAEALDSALAQTHPATEVIVVDDGSVDDTPAVLTRYAGRVRLLRQSRNRGPSAARNVGLRVARGEYIAFLDADDRFLPDKVARQAAVLDARPEVGLVYSGSRFFEDSDLPPALREMEGQAFQAAYLRGDADCYRAGLEADAARAFHAAARARPDFLGEPASLRDFCRGLMPTGVQHQDVVVTHW